MFSSLCYLLHVTLPESRILRRLLEFWKICTHLRKCIFIYTHKKIRPFPTPIFAEITNAQQNYVQISYTEFHPNLK